MLKIPSECGKFAQMLQIAVSGTDKNVYDVLLSGAAYDAVRQV